MRKRIWIAGLLHIENIYVSGNGAGMISLVRGVRSMLRLFSISFAVVPNIRDSLFSVSVAGT